MDFKLMRRLILQISFSAAALVLLCSCASVPVDVEKPHEMFPDKVPSNICYLRTVRSTRLIGLRTGFNSAGTLIEGQYLITAAHNLYDSWRTKLVSVQVSCKGGDGGVITSIVNESEIVKSRKVNHYDKSFSTDYAFLRLSEPIPVVESVTLNSHANISEIFSIEVAGYPGGGLKYGAGDVVKPIPNDSTFYYGVDTAKGMSGGPVWAVYQGIDSLVGIHVSEGRARVVNSKLIDDFQSWKAELR